MTYVVGWRCARGVPLTLPRHAETRMRKRKAAASSRMASVSRCAVALGRPPELYCARVCAFLRGARTLTAALADRPTRWKSRREALTACRRIRMDKPSPLPFVCLRGLRTPWYARRVGVTRPLVWRYVVRVVKRAVTGRTPMTGCFLRTPLRLRCMSMWLARCCRVCSMASTAPSSRTDKLVAAKPTPRWERRRTGD